MTPARRRVLLGVVAVARADADAAFRADDVGEGLRLAELAACVYNAATEGVERDAATAAWRDMYEWLGG